MIRLFTGEDCVIVDINGHSIHVIRTGNGEPKIYINDHATIRIHGKPKDKPEIVVDSDEFPTDLTVVQSESEWSLLRVPLGSEVKEK